MISRKSRSKSAISKHSGRLGKDENVAPWPEWSDIFVKTTVWNPNVPEVTPKVVKSGKSNKPESLPRASVRKSGTEGDLFVKCFNDGWSRKCESLAGEEVDSWVRAASVDGLKQTLVHRFTEKELDLVSSNPHLLSNTLIKEIVESVSCLNVASLICPFSAEFANQNFNPPGESWRPWHHVYSLNNAAAGDGHEPAYNEYGRYIVRLYFMGKWRRIEVDDYFPLNSEGKLLLPVTCRKDLWLAILTKALLRVITVYGESNITAITALTGWIKNTTRFRGASDNDVWNLCCSYLLKKNELLPETTDDIHCSYYGGSCLNDVRHLCESKFQDVFVFARITEPIYNLEDVEPEKRALFTLVYQVTQNWIRVEDYPPWKEYRWFDWAYKHNILKGKIGDVFKYVEIYSPVWESDLKCRDDSTSEVLLTVEEDPTIDFFREWTFEKFRECVEELEIYFLPSQFEHFYRSESLNVLELNSKSKGKSTEQGKSKSPESGSTRFYEQACRSFYILVDSPYCKKIFVDVMFFSNPYDSPSGHIVCEKFNWNEDTQGTPVFFMKTRGCTNEVIRAGPGRHAFRVWCEMPQSYFVQMFSNTAFVLENLDALQEMCVQDSVSYKLFGDQISEAFRELVKVEYGTEDHSRALKTYTESFYPTDLRQKSQLHENLVYRIPFDKLLDEAVAQFVFGTDLMKSITNAANFVMKMRRLLLNPGFGEEILTEFEHMVPPDVFDDVISHLTLATVVSAPKTKDKKTVQPASELFFDKSENNVKLLKIIMHKEESFLPLYPFCFDHGSKIVFHDFKGKVDVHTYHPFFIAARLLLNIHSLELVPCGVHRFLNHDFCRICVYDAATSEAVPVKFDRNSVWNLRRSETGYIFLVLCFNLGSQSKSKVTELHWKLRAVSFDENGLLHPCRLGSGHQHCNFKASAPQNVTETIRGYYVPNACNLITKFLVTLNQNDIITLQFSVSCPTAFIRTVVKGALEKTVKESEGKGNLLMPCVTLNLKDSFLNGNTSYFSGEVHLMYNSWTLSNEENNFLNQVKESYVPFTDITGSTKSRRKKSRTSTITTITTITTMLSIDKSEEAVPPAWTLTMMTESGHRDKSTKLIPDTRVYDGFKATHAQLGAEERLKHGSELRSEFNYYVNETLEEDKSFDKISEKYEFYQSELDKNR